MGGRHAGQAEGDHHLLFGDHGLQRPRTHAAAHCLGDLPVAETDSPLLVDAGDAFVSDYRPHIVFTCLGFPKQEYLMLALHERHPEVVFIGAGAAAQINTGHYPRAPRFMRSVGLEWVWRMKQDPSRLVKRYLLQDLPWLIGMVPVAVRERLRNG